MATPWGSAFDQDTVAEQACGPGMHWDAAQNACVPDALGDVDWQGVQKQAALNLLNDPNWAGNRPTMNQPVPNTSTGETLSGKDALARLNDPGWGGNWTPEELAYFNAAQETGFFGSPAAPAATVATNDSIPGALGEFDFNAAVADAGGIQAFLEDAAGFGNVPAAEVYSQQGIVDPGIDAAEQAWLDSADFTGDLGTVPAGQTMSTYDPDNPLLGDQVVDPRVQMRQDYAEQLLNEGYTVADIEQFMGVVGTQEYFENLAANEAYMASPAEAANVESALARIAETGTATQSWVESPEFAAMYGNPEDFISPDEGLLLGDEVVPGGENGAPALGGEEGAADGVPLGVPTYINTQVDEINIFNSRLKSITDAFKKLETSGLQNITDIENALTDAESEIYESQYGVRDPLTGELLTPGEMDRLRSTFGERRSTSKKNRVSDRSEIVQIMSEEGVDPALAESELNMIQALHGDAVDTQYDFIDSLWRIGKMSHDERTSMIGNMMGSYRLQLRDQVVEMLMAEEVSTADNIASAQQDALRADTIANLFPDMSEDQVYGLMRSGMADLLQLPADKEIGMITSGEWAGYTSGEKANVLLNAGYTQNTDGTFSPPAADAVAEGDKVLSKLMPDGTTWSGTADEYFNQYGKRIFAEDDIGEILEKTMPDGTTFTGTAQDYYDQYGTYIYADTYGGDVITKVLPDGTPFTGTVEDYVARSGVYPFAAAVVKDDPKKFTVSVDRIKELDPSGAWLKNEGLKIFGARPDSIQRPGSTGFVTMEWDDWIFSEDPYVAAKRPEDEERTYTTTVNKKPWTGTPQEYQALTGKYMFAPGDPAPIPVPSGLTTEAFPQLENVGIPADRIKVVDGEYWLTPEDINVYLQIAEIRNEKAPEISLDEMLRNGAYPGYPTPLDLRSRIQRDAVLLQKAKAEGSNDDFLYAGIPFADLLLTVVMIDAPKNEDYARLAAKYLGVNIDVHGKNADGGIGLKTGHINYRTGEFVDIGDLQPKP